MSGAGDVDVLACLDRDWRNDALAWARSLVDAVDPEAAWNVSKHGAWMVRLLGTMHRNGRLPRRALVLATSAVARALLVRLEGLDSHAAALAAAHAAERWVPADPACERARAAVRDVVWSYAVVGAPEGAALAACAALCAVDCAAADDAHEAAYAADDCAVACATAATEGVGPQLSEVAAAVRAAVPWPSVAAALGRGVAP